MRPSGDNVMSAWDRLVQGYNANVSSRFKRVQSGLPASGSGADYHYKSESQYLQLVEMVRDFERNSPIVKAAFNRLESNVVQGGFTVDVETGDPELDKRVTEKWDEWAHSEDECDAAGEKTFPEMERLGFRSMARDGDCAFVALNNGRLRDYEAHRMRTPTNTTRNVVHGWLLDKFRRRLEVWFTRDDIDPWRVVSKVGDMTQIPVRDAQGFRQVFHLYHPERMSQTRGIGWCVPAVDTIGMHDDIQFAKMVQQKVVSCFTVFLKRSEGWNPEDGASAADGSPTRSDYTAGLRRELQELFPGKLIEGLPGEELEGFSPNVPNPEFFQHALLLLTFVAANLDLPLQVLLLDPTKTNFSGWRGAIDQARLRFQQLQSLMIRRFHEPVYRWKIRQWLRSEPWLQEAARRGLNVFAHQWKAPGWEYMERFTDAQADTLIVASGLESRRRLLARRGLRHDQIAEELAEDNALIIEKAIDRALKLNETYGEQLKKFGMSYVDWHEIAAMPLPQGVSVHLGNRQLGGEVKPDSGDDAAGEQAINRIAPLLNGSRN